MALDRKSELAQNLAAVRATIPNDVHLIVVTKTFPVSDAQILHELGVSEFGENRDQEGKEKAPLVSGKWHFQGQLQSNKLKSICSWADVIQTIDTTRYVELVSKAAQKDIEVFIQRMWRRPMNKSSWRIQQCKNHCHLCSFGLRLPWFVAQWSCPCCDAVWPRRY